MSAKTYKSFNNLSVPVVENGKIIKRVSFTDEGNTLRTSDESLQRSLESLPCYGILFKLYREEEVAEFENLNVGGDLKEYPEITEWPDAKELLRKEYNVSHQSLNTPDNILKKAKEVGVCFPSLKIEKAE